MKTLIVEDDFTSRLLLQTFLTEYGECHIAVNGMEAVEAYRMAVDGQSPYDLVCMDIRMPGMDGREAARQMRLMEEANGILPSRGVKIVMTTAVTDVIQVMQSFRELCDAYLFKPIDTAKLLGELTSLGLVR
jgi:two-component system chemotaxis response regulator CheY